MLVMLIFAAKTSPFSIIRNFLSFKYQYLNVFTKLSLIQNLMHGVPNEDLACT